MSLTSALSALESSSTPEAADKLRRIKAILEEASPISRVIARLLEMAPKFDYVNPNITGANFPTTTEPSLEGARLDKIVGSREHVLAELARNGRRAATAAEGLLYGVQNPDEQRKYWIWCLGQVWVHSVGRREYALVLGEGDGRRGAGLRVVALDVAADERGLSFPL